MDSGLTVNTIECPKHGPYEGATMLTKTGAVFKAHCPLCLELEEKYKDELIKRDETRRIKKELEYSNIEPEYYEATLDNFIIPEKCVELLNAKIAIERMINGEVKKIVMHGLNGTGKTHLGVCAVKAMGGKIFTMYEIATRIRSTYSARSKEDELEVVSELARLPLLVIDEIGRTKGSEAEANWLSFIIDKRHTRKLPLILITNKHLKKNCQQKGCENCLEHYLGNDIIDRMAEGGMMLSFTMGSYRRKQGSKE